MFDFVKHFLESLNISIIPENASVFQKLVFYEIILLLITLISILRLAGYFVALYIIKNTSLTENYKFLKRFVGFYEKLSFIYIIYDIAFISIVYLFLIFIGLCFLWPDSIGKILVP